MSIKVFIGTIKFSENSLAGILSDNLKTISLVFKSRYFKFSENSLADILSDNLK